MAKKLSDKNKKKWIAAAILQLAERDDPNDVYLLMDLGKGPCEITEEQLDELVEQYGDFITKTADNLVDFIASKIEL